MSFSLVIYNLNKNNPKGKVRSRPDKDKDKDIDKTMSMDAMLLDIQPYLILCLVETS
jgi:hypothetical protein